MGYSTKRSNRHFLRAMLSRSISSVNHTTVRHKFSIPETLLAGSRKVVRGLQTNTSAYPPALERTLRGGVKQANCCAAYAATFESVKSMKHTSENQSQEVLAGRHVP